MKDIVKGLATREEGFIVFVSGGLLVAAALIGIGVLIGYAIWAK